MKQLYVSLLVLFSLNSVCQENEHKKEVMITQESPEALEEDAVNRALMEKDEDDFYEDMLEKMIEIGAIDEEIEMKPMPWWKVWLLRVGSSLFAKYDTCKTFVSNRYDDCKYIAAVAWAKIRGKKVRKRNQEQQIKENKKTEHEECA